MPTIEKSTTLSTSPAKVFNRLADRANAPSIVPNLIRTWDIKPAQAAMGQTWSWEYRLLGKSITGQSEIVAFESNKLLKFHTTGKLKSTWTYTITPQGKGSKVTVSVKYDLPDTLWAKIKNRIAYSRINESQIEHLLANLHAQLA